MRTIGTENYGISRIALGVAIAVAVVGLEMNCDPGLAMAIDLPLEVCDVARDSNSTVRVRGVARVESEGFLMSDATCPIWSGKNSALPMRIRVLAKVFVRSSDRERFDEMRDGLEKPLFQVIVRGRMSCRSPFLVKSTVVSGQLRGNGFGPTGLVPCAMEEAVVEGLWPL